MPLRLIVYSSLVIILLASCKNDISYGQSEALHQHFKGVNAVLDDANSLLYERHDQDRQDPMTATIVARWTPAITSLLTLKKQTVEKIDHFCDKIKDLKPEELKKTDRVIKKEAGDLYMALAGFSKQIPALFSSVNFTDDLNWQHLVSTDISRIQKECFTRLNGGDTAGTVILSQDDFLHLYFWGSGPANALAMAQKLKSDVLLTERTVLTYINTSYTKEKLIYNTGVPFVRVSNKTVRPGDSLFVAAMLMTVVRMDSLQIAINGTPVALNEQATAIQTITAGQQQGKTRIPVTFRYREADGRLVTETQYAEFTIKP